MAPGKVLGVLVRAVGHQCARGQQGRKVARDVVERLPDRAGRRQELLEDLTAGFQSKEQEQGQGVPGFVMLAANGDTRNLVATIKPREMFRMGPKTAERGQCATQVSDAEVSLDPRLALERSDDSDSLERTVKSGRNIRWLRSVSPAKVTIARARLASDQDDD